MAYSTPTGHVFLDRWLYLPKVWCRDRDRRITAQVTADVVFQTKPEQGSAMLEHAWAQNVPMRWVTGDEVYGDDSRLRERVEQQECGCMLAVSSTTPIRTERPSVKEPVRTTGGRPRTKVCLAPEAPPATTVAAVVAT